MIKQRFIHDGSMEIKVIRSVFSPTTTLGKMYIDNQFYAFTCEDTVREIKANCTGKIKNKTAISDGKYEIVQSYSERFGKYLPLLLNVPCFEGIRIHGGNTSLDSEGCILIGEHGDMIERIWNCRQKVISLVALLKKVEKKEKVWIEIINQR